MTQPAVPQALALRSPEDHLAEILATVAPLVEFGLPLLEAHGCVIAEDVLAPFSAPASDCAALDGYAVRSADIADAAADRPVRLSVLDDVVAGSWQVQHVTSGTAIRTVTGAVLPGGADTVVPRDCTDAGIAAVQVRRPVEAGSNVRRQGEDITAGTQVAARGDIVGPLLVALLAAAGRDRVLVRPTPRVVVVSVGDELTEPTSAPRPGTAVDVNSYALSAAARQAGAVAYPLGAVPDDPDQLRSLLDDNLIRGDLIVTTGGIGAGERDVVRAAVTRLGEITFHQLALDPGPLHGFGTVGPDDTPICCLPGDPVSALTGFELFVRPALRRLAGHAGIERSRRRATVTDAVASAMDVRSYRFGTIEERDGRAVVRPCAPRLSVGYADANALIVVPAGAGRVEVGAEVDVELLDGAGRVPQERRAP